MKISSSLKRLALGLVGALALLPITLTAQQGFNANLTQGCSPLVVNFTANVPGATAYNWDLGNGTFSAQANPGATYVNPGFYTITLTATFGNGTTQTFTRTNYIEALAPPSPNFQANVQAICEGGTINFTDQSIPGSQTITSWLWDFGDGTTSTLRNPTHSYRVPGVFTVTLIAKDVFGCDATIRKTQFITVNATPKADFVADNALGCSTPFPVNFLSTGANLGGNVSHQWSLGVPGVNPTVANPSYTYLNNGSYTVTHIVSDPIGCSDTVTKINYINVGANQVSIQVSDTVICLGDPITINCGGGPGSLASWNMGVSGPPILGCNNTYTYTAPGRYTITATITTTNGCSFTASQQVRVSTPPSIDFSVSDTLFCDPPFNVTFIQQTTGAVSHQWNFGDGSSSTMLNPNHTYPVLPIVGPNGQGQPYEYNVTLTAQNADGCESSLTKFAAVTTGQTRARLEIPFLERSGCAPHTVNFRDISVSPSTITSWMWDFGDGNTSQVTNPVHTYTDTGTWDVSLIIETLHGCRDTVQAIRAVTAGKKPTAAYSLDSTIFCASDPVPFVNESICADSANWQLGPIGANTYDFGPVVEDTGYFDLRLIVFDRGCPDTLTDDSVVYILGPVARFTPDLTIHCALPAPVQFNDTSILARRWLWDFGDGSPLDSSRNPQHVYTQEGNFVVTLTVFNDSTGCEFTETSIIRVEEVEADFTLDTTFGCLPLPVKFTDQSLNPVFWQWSFGDGNFSRLPNPTHTYDSAGIYTVSLSVVNSIGCNDDTVATALVSAYRPQIAFNLDDTTVCAPATVFFNQQVSSLLPIVQWNWQFGLPGLGSTLPDPVQTFTIPGFYNIGLTATDSLGCTNSITKFSHLQVNQPIPDFSVDHPINCINNAIVFNNVSTGLGLTYLWDFGDGNTATSANPVHSYTQNGVYTVSLTIRDAIGCDSTLTLSNYITIATPQVTFTADTTTADCPPLLVNFMAQGTSPHPFNQWLWDFGDSATSVGQNPSHLYISSDSFPVQLIATDPAGCSDTLRIPDYIQISGPQGDFSISPLSGCPGTPISFVSSDTVNIVTWTWDFANGVLGTGPDTSYAYPAPGRYIPKLILKDQAGCEVVLVSPDTVDIAPGPVANFSADSVVLCDRGGVQFADLSTPNDTIVSWQWILEADTSNLQNPSYFLSQQGSFDVRLVVINEHGCTDTLLMPAFIRVSPRPEPKISASDTVGCVPFSTQLQVLTPGHPVPISTYLWGIGPIPIQPSTLPQPVYTFTQAGDYRMGVFIADSLGCNGYDTLIVTALPLPPVDFTASDSLGCAPKGIDFQAMAPTAIAWQWMWGDGGFDSGATASHTFLQEDTFDISLAVTDTNGCTNTLTKPELIRLTSPDANFELSAQILCPGTDISFTDLSQGPYPIVQWLWHFGDGQTSATGPDASYSYSSQGMYDITLIITDSLGCIDTLVQPAAIEVIPDEQPEQPIIEVATVQNAQTIDVFFDSYENSRKDFDRYVWYRGGSMGWDSVGTSQDLSLTQWSDDNIQAEETSYCYVLEVVNNCENRSNWSEPHCTMWLQATPDLEAIQLDWSAYVGWQPGSYRIYRVSDYDLTNVQLIGTVAGDLTSYLDDETHCDDSVSYRIEAFPLDLRRSSWSNIDTEAPIHIPPSNPLHMSLATVENNQQIALRWDTLTHDYNWQQVIIEKNTNGAYLPWQIYDADLGITQDIDRQVVVEAQSYAYRAIAVDTCGDSTLRGRIARSIHLTATQQVSDIAISWNAYEDWENGVEQYRLEVFDESVSQWIPVVTLPANQLTHLDTETDLLQPEYCYRVWADALGQSQLASLSNEDCVPPLPQLFFPNAFSPNGDQINDLFLLKGKFLASYELTIFNRWGEKLYEGNSLENGWDGSYKGKPVPEGVYVYRATGTGYEGSVISRVGTVTLFR